MWLFAPSNVRRRPMQTADSDWRPRRDLNPCYRRESRGPVLKLALKSSHLTPRIVSCQLSHATSNTPAEVSLHSKEQEIKEEPLRQSRS